MLRLPSVFLSGLLNSFSALLGDSMCAVRRGVIGEEGGVKLDSNAGRGLQLRMLTLSFLVRYLLCQKNLNAI